MAVYSLNTNLNSMEKQITDIIQHIIKAKQSNWQ